jgi:hypothetical protein
VLSGTSNIKPGAELNYGSLGSHTAENDTYDWRSCASHNMDPYRVNPQQRTAKANASFACNLTVPGHGREMMWLSQQCLWLVLCGKQERLSPTPRNHMPCCRGPSQYGSHPSRGNLHFCLLTFISILVISQNDLVFGRRSPKLMSFAGS